MTITTVNGEKTALKRAIFDFAWGLMQDLGLRRAYPILAMSAQTQVLHSRRKGKISLFADFFGTPVPHLMCPKFPYGWELMAINIPFLSIWVTSIHLNPFASFEVEK